MRVMVENIVNELPSLKNDTLDLNMVYYCHRWTLDGPLTSDLN